ncbi:MAG: DUF4268 domain-containing protein [Candidatus Bathyarchaeia archaeon]
MEFFESIPYAKDNNEENLHRIVEDHPKLVAIEEEDASRLPTMVIGSHFRLPTAEEIDLLLMDVTGILTIVELKRDHSPRDVVAQILDYASSLYQLTFEDFDRAVREQSSYKGGLEEAIEKLRKENPDYQETDPDKLMTNIKESVSGENLKLLIVSYKIDQSIRKVTEYLRDVYGMRIYCVEFDYFSSDEHEYFIPETIGIDEVKRIESREMTDTQRNDLQFFSDLLDRLRKQRNLTQQKAQPQSWLAIPIGHAYVHLAWAFHGRPRDSFEVGLYLENPTLEENERIEQSLKRDEIELRKELGDLKFEDYGKKGEKRRIRVVRPGGEMSEELKNWAVTTMVKFYDAFRPRLEKLA